MNGSSSAVDPMVESILTWWDRTERSLPWRDTRDPWAILVSEVMSQQTQVERVVPKWEAFMERFPTPRAAAQSTAGDVISMWDGLGYNRRALLLHRCAIEVEDHHGGELPSTLDALLALPGIGPYTARAILAFAFERDVAVLDTNVGRVLARTGGRSLTPVEAQRFAERLVPVGRGWEWNQALLDFGSQVCQKRTPQCVKCPVREVCAWVGDGEDPASGSAAVSTPQSTFVGSDRQGRGRLVAALRSGPVLHRDVSVLMGFGDDDTRTTRVLAALVADGMVVLEGDVLRLP